jgi:RNA methyltransferase, TrmH family
MVNSLSHNQATAIRKLHQQKYRKLMDSFFAEGGKVVTELLASPLQVRQVVCLESWFGQHQNELQGVEVFLVSRREMDRISLLQTPQDVLAVASIPDMKIDSLPQNWNRILVLDSIRDPGNMGTLIRSAEWFGFEAVIASHDCVEFFNPKVVQSAMGSLFRMLAINEDLSALIKNLKQRRNFDVLALVLDGRPIEESFIGDLPSVLIVGSESHGISSVLMELANQKITIPRSGSRQQNPESLNAAVAAGIVMHHLQTKKAD